MSRRPLVTASPQWIEDVSVFQQLLEHETDSLWAQAEHARRMAARHGRHTARALAGEVGLSAGYIRQLIATADAFPDPATRAQDFSFSHHRICAQTADPAHWLALAVAHQWSVDDLRHAIRDARDPVARDTAARRAAERLQRAVNRFNTDYAPVLGQRVDLLWSAWADPAASAVTPDGVA